MMELFLTIFFISVGIACLIPILILLVGEIILTITSGPPSGPPRPIPRPKRRNWRANHWRSGSWSRGE